MNYNYLQQGGLTSIPARPVFRGQQHQLGYLTPNQSELLRRQGGGVTPFGGQYKGPGGLNTFFSPLAPTPEDGQPPGPVNGLGGTTHRRWWSCFVAGAEILLDNHMVKKVEEVEKGDRVHGIDEQINTVKSLISTITGGRRLISINNGNYFTTEDHPFMVANGSWKSCNGKMSQEKYPELNVDQLQIGDKIKGHLNKKTEVESINFKEVSSDTPLYNFELDNDHTYIVNNYVMHNKLFTEEGWERSEEERRVRRDPFYTESSSTSLPSTPSVGRDPFSTEPSPTSLPSTPSVERDPFSKEPSAIPEESFFNTILNNFLTGEKNRWILQYPNYPTTPISTGFSPDVLPSLPPAPTESHPTKNGDLSYFPTTPVFPSLPSGYGYPSTTPTPATTPIPPTSTPTVATNPLFPITPPSTPAAETVTPEAPLTLGSGTVLGSPESAGQFNFQGKSFHIHPAQHGGGIQSLPIRPVLAGQQHELSYITPEEAQLLRQYGGGVTPDGGQYRGPGGVPAFLGHSGPSTSNSGGTNVSTPVGSGTGHGGPAAGPGSEAGSTAPGGVGDPSGPGPGHSPFSPGFRSAYKSDEARKKAETIKARLAIQQLTLNNEDGRINPDSYQAMLDDPLAAFEPSFFSREGLFGLVENALSHGLTDVTTHGDMDSTFGHVTAITPGQAESGIAVPAHDRTNVGDAYSGFGRAILGLTDILGMVAPPIGLLGNVLSLGRMAGLVDLPSLGDLGLMSLIGDTIGDISTGDDGETIGDALSDVFAPITSLTDEFGNIVGDAVNTVYEGITGLADESGLSSLYSSIDLGSFDGGTSTDPGKGGGPGVQVYYPTTPDLIKLAKENEEKEKKEELARLLDEQEPGSPEEKKLLTIEDIRNRYVGVPGDITNNEVITVQGGGGIQDLINKQHEEYSVGNQNNIPSFNKATPHPDLMNGSDGYISNILKGHTVPMGMTNVQQMQKPIEAFPTGGQMNTTNTQYADYSKPQSFYAMPNMNRVT